MEESGTLWVERGEGREKTPPPAQDGRRRKLVYPSSGR